MTAKKRRRRDLKRAERLSIRAENFDIEARRERSMYEDPRYPYFLERFKAELKWLEKMKRAPLGFHPERSRG